MNILFGSELSAAVRADLKKSGYGAKSVSVRNKHNSIRVAVKDLTISLSDIKEITMKYQHYQEDMRTYEILEGANTFVFVYYDEKIVEAEKEKYLDYAKSVVSNSTDTGKIFTIAKNDKYSLLYGRFENFSILETNGKPNAFHLVSNDPYDYDFIAKALVHFNARGINM